MADGDGSPSSGPRHTGVVRRSDLPRSRPSTARRDWLALVGVATMMVIVLVVLAGFFGDRPTADPSTSPNAMALASQTPTLKPTYSAEPTATPTSSPTPSPTPSPSATPSPTPTASPTPSPSPMPSATPSPTPLPTPPSTGLIIVEPGPSSRSNVQSIVIRGLAAPGSVITRDVPLWFDEHTTADAAGNWSFVEPLNTGWNEFVFRVGDDRNTEVRLLVQYIAD